MKNMPDTFSIDYACLQISPFEKVILCFQDILTNKIGKQAQEKHFRNRIAKRARLTVD